MANTTFIYELIDPRSNETRYIGKSNNPQRRLKDEHLKEIGDTHKIRWIKQLQRLNLIPVLNIIDEVSESDWDFWERFYIRQFRLCEFRLVNDTDGGDGVKDSTGEVGRKVSRALMGRKVSQEQVQRALETKRRNNSFGQTKEALDKRVAKITGMKRSKEICEKFSKSHIGIHPTEETKQKLRERLKGRVFTEEWRRELSKANTGKHLSEEAKFKISEFWRKRRENKLKK